MTLFQALKHISNMAFLLDTHTLLWAILNDKNLSSNAKKYLSDTAHIVYYSPVSQWEITINHSLGSLDLRITLDECFDIITKTGFIELPLHSDQFITLSKLPHHHKDPFDRMLVAQAICNNLRIITKDSIIPKYDVETIW